MQTQKKVMWNNVGNPSTGTTLTLNPDAPKPAAPEPGFVQIKVKAVSINPVDYKIMEGQFAKDPKRVYPKGTGTDVSGIVEAVGTGVSTFKVGDEVYCDAIMLGPIAEYVNLPIIKTCIKPSNVSFEEAATFPLAGLTALQALRDKGSLKKGGSVLIFGGSGGVGSMAIQIAKSMGATTIATTSSNEEMCTQLGATQVVNYKKEKVEDALTARSFDVVFDCVGGYDYWVSGSKLLKTSGIYVSIAGDGGVSLPTMMGRVVARKLKSFIAAPNYSIFLTNSNGKDLDVLKEMVEKGDVKAIIEESFPFSEDGVRAMFGKLMGGRTKGKLVMTVA
jgi:alcohol dehydrogenase